ncbi:hypothetical protein PITC_070920 [Penicillium italicum]|uniref:Uncharacterized protein n=1 Tax=Penicillium italicum TaxID=40296 RepID=A0A0A2KKX0_PENIT|nr:hypothetical protein PITC_070920 [Penicillium italicum]
MPSSRVTEILLFPRATFSPFPTTCRSISTQPLRPQLHPRQQNPQQLPRPTISLFSTSNSARAREPKFYEILDVPTTASAAEIKKYIHTQHPTPIPPPLNLQFHMSYRHKYSQCLPTP